MRKLLAVLFGVLVVGLALASLPARLLPLFAGDQVLLSGLSGSVWSGSAARAVVATPAGPFHLGQLRWTLSPISLLSLSPSVQVQTEWGAQRIKAQIKSRGGEVHLSDVDATFDASLVRQFAPVDVTGRLSLLFKKLVFSDELLLVDGRLTWQDATWYSASSQYRLGSYVAEFSSPETRQVHASIDTISGTLQVQGNASLDAGRYATDITVDSDGREPPAEIARALSLIAVPQDTGYLLRLEGEIR